MKLLIFTIVIIGICQAGTPSKYGDYITCITDKTCQVIDCKEDKVKRYFKNINIRYVNLPNKQLQLVKKMIKHVKLLLHLSQLPKILSK